MITCGFVGVYRVNSTGILRMAHLVGRKSCMGSKIRRKVRYKEEQKEVQSFPITHTFYLNGNPRTIRVSRFRSSLNVILALYVRSYTKELGDGFRCVLSTHYSEPLFTLDS